MAQRYRCKTETDLFENGIPICPKCANEKDRGRPRRILDWDQLDISCPERDRLVEALLKASEAYQQAVTAMDGTTGNDSTFALEKTGRAKAECTRLRNDLRQHDEEHRCKK